MNVIIVYFDAEIRLDVFIAFNGIIQDKKGVAVNINRILTMVEINPLVITGDNRILALDAKMTFDDNALFRHPNISELRDKSQEDPRESRAADRGLSYVGLEGNIGCIVNGAGLAMATMDTIKLAGGEEIHQDIHPSIQ